MGISHEDSSTKPATHNGDLKRLPAALQPFTTRPNWVNWAWRFEKGRWAKPPLNPQNLRQRARPGDPTSWGSYDQAVRNVGRKGVDGIGLMLADLPLNTVDLDDCYCSKTKKPASWAQAVIDNANGAYIETTPSGEGFHLIGLTATEEDKRVDDSFPYGDNGKVERYRRALRYITITGLQIGTCEKLETNDAFFDGLLLEKQKEQDDLEDAEDAPVLDDDFDPDDDDEPDDEDVETLIQTDAPIGERSEKFASVVWKLANEGYSAKDIVEKLAGTPIAEKYAKGPRKEVDRLYRKWLLKHRGLSIKDFAYFSPKDKCIFMPTGDLWASNAVDRQVIKPRKKMDPTSWLAHNRAVAQMAWSPGDPQIIKGRIMREGGWIEHPQADVFNAYRGPTIMKAPGPINTWRDHLYQLYPDEGAHIEMWMAHRVQRPGEKINHLIVLGGEQRIGKDTLFEPLRHAVGPWNFKDVTSRDFMAPYGDWQKSVVVCINEAHDQGRDTDRFALYQRLKTFSAAPPNALLVNEKFIPQYYALNVCGIAVTTNYDDALPLPMGDKRAFVAWALQKEEDFKEAYWVKFWDYYANGGLEHVAHYLGELDLRKFNPKAPPPRTEAFYKMVATNSAPEAGDMADALERLGWPPAVTLEMIRESKISTDFFDWLGDRKNARKISYRFKDCEYAVFPNSDSQQGLWVIRGKRCAVYTQAGLTMQECHTAVRALQDGTIADFAAARRKRDRGT